MFDASEMKIISISAPTWLKMLRTREAKIFDKIYGEFRNGRTDFVALVAEFATIREQINEITKSLKLQDNQGE